jgi:2-keto-4-pentenoate hydratase/2-oxohepta-3-ene-1,7-dioic acid hydratase in catechol pathway
MGDRYDASLHVRTASGGILHRQHNVLMGVPAPMTKAKSSKNFAGSWRRQATGDPPPLVSWNGFSALAPHIIEDTVTNFLRFMHDGKQGLGILNDAGDSVAILDGDLFAGARPTGRSLPLAGLSLLPPVVPSKIVALWNNSRSGAEKQKLDPPGTPLYFIKTPNSHLAPGAAIRKPASYDGRVIFEAELGVVIGKTCRNVGEAEASDYVFGYTCVNDVTALQIIREDASFAQWSRAKNFDTFTPFGPWITTAIAPDTLPGLAIRAELNGRERQSYPVSDLFFSPLQLVSLISRDMTLEPGDVISCGTGPGAVSMKPGDRIEIVIDRIGRLTNDYAA